MRYRENASVALEIRARPSFPIDVGAIISKDCGATFVFVKSHIPKYEGLYCLLEIDNQSTGCWGTPISTCFAMEQYRPIVQFRIVPSPAFPSVFEKAPICIGIFRSTHDVKRQGGSKVLRRL